MTATNSNARGRNPLITLPGKRESLGGGRPNQYLRGPNFTMRKESAAVAMVAMISTMGKDWRTGVPRERDRTVTKTCWCVR